MDFYRKYWYYIGGIYFVLLSYYMGFWGHNISHIQTILIYSFMAVLVHQFEEYAAPGGFPAVMNIVMNGEKEMPDRYPLNKNNSFIVNVILAYPFYIIAIFIPQVIWYGLAQVLFGMMQFFIHGLFVNKKMKSWYNPGLASVVFLHIPLGIYYIWYVATNGLARTQDYFFGVIAVVAAAVLMIGIPVRRLANRNTKYPFTKAEMERFHVKEKMDKIQSR